MRQIQLTTARVRQLLTAAAKTRILVVGDIMLDHFIWGNVSRISPEAPVPVVKIDRTEDRPGGAANVARNAAAFRKDALACCVPTPDGSCAWLRTRHVLQRATLRGAGRRRLSCTPPSLR